MGKDDFSDTAESEAAYTKKMETRRLRNFSF